MYRRSFLLTIIAGRASETSSSILKSTWFRNPEDFNLHPDRSQNLKTHDALPYTTSLSVCPSMCVYIAYVSVFLSGCARNVIVCVAGLSNPRQ